MKELKNNLKPLTDKNAQLVTRYIKNWADSTKYEAFSSHLTLCVLIVNRSEMPNFSYTHPLPPMLKIQCNTIMTEQKRTYERIINRVTDQLLKLTIGQGKEYEKVLFFADPHFLFLIPDAHLAHCLLPANTQAKRQGKSQRAKLPTLLYNRLISKVVFHSKKGNKLVTL